MPNYYIGRQAILDRNCKVVAYEMLYRAADEDSAPKTFDGDMATSQVIVNAYLENTVDKLVGKNQCFVNLTQYFIENPELLPPPDSNIVLEILESIEITKNIIERVRELKEQGYTIALDDYVHDEDKSELIELADIVKVDVFNLDKQQIEQQFNSLKTYNKTLLAEKIETPEIFSHCVMLGFDLFQGYFLYKPQVLEGKRPPANHTSTLTLLSKLMNPDISMDELAELIGYDLNLTHKLLRYINSAAVYTTKEINTIRQAVVICGTKTLRQWAMLLALSSMNDKSRELLACSLVRAKMCNMMFEESSSEDAESVFLVGLLSTIDSILDQPLEEIIKDLPISDDTRAALIEHTGLKGDALECAVAYELGDWSKARFADLDTKKISDIYVESIDWAENTIKLVA